MHETINELRDEYGATLDIGEEELNGALIHHSSNPIHSSEIFTEFAVQEGRNSYLVHIPILCCTDGNQGIAI